MLFNQLSKSLKKCNQAVKFGRLVFVFAGKEYFFSESKRGGVGGCENRLRY